MKVMWWVGQQTSNESPDAPFWNLNKYSNTLETKSLISSLNTSPPPTHQITCCIIRRLRSCQQPDRKSWMLVMCRKLVHEKLHVAEAAAHGYKLSILNITRWFKWELNVFTNGSFGTLALIYIYIKWSTTNNDTWLLFRACVLEICSEMSRDAVEF